MCGIAGFLLDKKISTLSPEHTIIAMTSSLTHRGPDEQRYWCSSELGIALGHTRLAIQDLSAQAAQPFVSPSGKQLLVFNGEIYNFSVIRDELRRIGHAFRSESDTEVLLLSFVEWGVERALERMEGMFAFAFLDSSSGEIILGRDRMGEKPLYYGRVGPHFVFASELKAIKKFPGGEALRPCRQASASFLRFGFVPGPSSIFEGIFKLPPGHLLRIDLASGKEQLLQYWSLAECGSAGSASPFSGSEAEAKSSLESVLRQVVRQQMVADVPLGAFLSGGIDSSLVVALMQAETGRRVKTYTIGFHEGDFNEAGHAAKVARYLGTEHSELYASARDALRVIERLPAIYDEPFADSSQIPTFLVAELARHQVKVCLTGDGGDEAFAGYNRHYLCSTIWRDLEKVPTVLRVAAARALAHLPPKWRNKMASTFVRALPEAHRPRQLAEKIDKLLLCLGSENFPALYVSLLSLIRAPLPLLAEGLEKETVFLPGVSAGVARVHAAQYLDSVFYLPDDLLVKVDRAAMAVGLETRAPFLDRRVLDFAWSLPAEMRIRGRQGKWLLRELLNRHIPPALTDRPKSGFAIPINHWLKGELRDWAESLLSERALQREGLLNVRPVRDLWERYLTTGENSHYQLWNILMFQAWSQASRENQVAGLLPKEANPEAR